MKMQTNPGFSILEALLVMVALAVIVAIMAINNGTDVSLEDVGRQQYLTNIAAQAVKVSWNSAVEAGKVDPAVHPDVESRVRVLIAQTDLGLDSAVSKDLRTGRISVGDVAESLRATDSGRLRCMLLR